MTEEQFREIEKKSREIDINSNAYGQLTTVAGERVSKALFSAFHSRFPFYSILLMQTIKEFSVKIPTMGVTLMANGRYKLIINPFFAMGLSDDHLEGVLLHEIMHLAFGHVFTLPTACPIHQIANIAADCFINTKIDKKLLPDMRILPSQFGMPDDWDTFQYYNHLLQHNTTFVNQVCSNLKGDKSDSDGQGSGGSESDQQGSNTDIGRGQGHYWENEGSSIEEREAIKEMAKDLLAQNMEDAAEASNSRGNLPAGILDILNSRRRLTPPLADWKKILRQFVSASVSSDPRQSYLRTNKRYDEAPGRKFSFKNTIYVGVDTSGSVSSEDIALFYTEIQNIRKASGCDVYICSIDTQINKVEKMSKDTQPTRAGGGGTIMQVFFDFLENDRDAKKCGSAVLLTDGYIDDLKIDKPTVICVTHTGNTKLNIESKHPVKIVQFQE